MKRLWNMEFYKLRKSVYLKLACLGAVLYGFAEFWAISMAYADDICGFSALIGSFLNWEKPYLFCGIFAAFYISGDMEGGAIEEEIIGGFNRKSIYIVKTGLFFAGSLAVIFCYQFIPTILYSCLNGFTNVNIESIWKELFYMEGTYLILMVACISSCILFSFIFTKKAASIVAEVVYIMIFLPIFQNITRTSETVSRIYRLLPYHKFQLIIGNIVENCNRDTGSGLILPPETVGMFGQIGGMGEILFCSGIAFLLMVLSGYVVFRYSQLR